MDIAVPEIFQKSADDSDNATPAGAAESAEQEDIDATPLTPRSTGAPPVSAPSQPDNTGKTPVLQEVISAPKSLADDQPARKSRSSPRPDNRRQHEQQANQAMADLLLELAPKADDSDDRPAILCSAVLGLFPMANQGLLRDTQAMVAADHLDGPVQSFIRLGVSLEAPPPTEPDRDESPQASATAYRRRQSSLGPFFWRMSVSSRLRPLPGPRPFAQRRECSGLVVHEFWAPVRARRSPTSVGDHPGRRSSACSSSATSGRRWMWFSIGSLTWGWGTCAPWFTTRGAISALYRSIRQQLDELHETSSDAKAQAKLAKVDGELQGASQRAGRLS